LSSTVWIVSHGPDCLDGVAAAVVVAKGLGVPTTVTRFASNPEVSLAICAVPLPLATESQQVWITDISWSDAKARNHLRSLAAAGSRIFWIDHHESAIERWRRGEVDVPLAGYVLCDRFAASRLTYDYLWERVCDAQARRRLEPLRRLVLLADDNDRWIHAYPESRELALTVATMEGTEAYEELMRVGPDLRYTEKMQAAWERVKRLLVESRALAECTRREVMVRDVRLVTASCAGYPSEVADGWSREERHAVFVLFDSKSKGVSFRRTPDCPVNLARLAEKLGGGGHAAAAGCKVEGLEVGSASDVLQATVAPILEALLSGRSDRA